MRAPISVIIPTLNAADRIGPTLGALAEGLEAGLIRELIISDGGSTDEIVEIADAIGADLVSGQPSRGGQLRRGARHSQGEWLLVLHADTVLAPGWTRVVMAHVRDCPDMAACFRLRFDARGYWPWQVAGWANLRTRLLSLAYGDQALLLPRRLYDAVGGYADVPLMEDVLMARALGRRMVLLAHDAVTDASRYQRDGWARRGLGNLWTLTRFLTGTPPERLAKSYEGKANGG